MRRAATAVWMTLAFACSARAQWPYVNKKLTARQITIHKVVLLPALVSFDKVSAKGSEGGVPLGDEIARSFYAAVSNELGERGVEVLPNPLEAARDDAARYAIADLQARYDNVAVQVRKKPGRVEKGRFTLGDRVEKFEPGAAADALVFVRGSGRIMTATRKVVALATLNPVGVSGVFRGEVAVIGSRSGEVLAWVRFLRENNMTQKTDDRLAKSIHQALRDIPFPLAATKH